MAPFERVVSKSTIGVGSNKERVLPAVYLSVVINGLSPRLESRRMSIEYRAPSLTILYCVAV